MTASLQQFFAISWNLCAIQNVELAAMQMNIRNIWTESQVGDSSSHWLKNTRLHYTTC